MKPSLRGSEANEAIQIHLTGIYDRYSSVITIDVTNTKWTKREIFIEPNMIFSQMKSSN